MSKSSWWIVGVLAAVIIIVAINPLRQSCVSNAQHVASSDLNGSVQTTWSNGLPSEYDTAPESAASAATTEDAAVNACTAKYGAL